MSNLAHKNQLTRKQFLSSSFCFGRAAEVMISSCYQASQEWSTHRRVNERMNAIPNISVAASLQVARSYLFNQHYWHCVIFKYRSMLHTLLIQGN